MRGASSPHRRPATGSRPTIEPAESAFQRGSAYAQGTLFPGTMSEFSLIDVIVTAASSQRNSRYCQLPDPVLYDVAFSHW